MGSIESLKKQAKTYDEVHNIEIKRNHAIHKMIPTSTLEDLEKLKDKIKARDKKQWVHIDVVLPLLEQRKNIISKLNQEAFDKDIELQEVRNDNKAIEASYKKMYEEKNRALDGQIADLKEKLQSKREAVKSLADKFNRTNEAKAELEGRLQKTELLLHATEKQLTEASTGEYRYLKRLSEIQKELETAKEALSTDHHLPQCCEKNLILLIDVLAVLLKEGKLQ